MIWARFSFKDVGCIIVVEDTINSGRQINTLERKLLPSANEFCGTEPWIFEDEARPTRNNIHRSNRSIYEYYF